MRYCGCIVFYSEPMLGIFMSSYKKENSNKFPRGLFFDLTDEFNNDESNFDNVQGFTTNDIYQLLTQDIYTIQELRAEWLNLRTNATTRPIHELLFNRYNIN